MPSQSPAFPAKIPQMAENNAPVTQIAKFFANRDEFSIKNIRANLWAAILVFPLCQIMSNLRIFDIGITVLGFRYHEYMLFTYGFGWLVLFFLPK
uniref:Uncharacterized protein n=1 Tax=uncultured bacterium contig00053 TaxID=1181537 RepID=A0A806KMX4_9BACT|nr:hypothetical protein [uncultured bacterium contig00053]